MRTFAMQLRGIHHLTAISADAPGNHRFYTRTLSMRLVKKTVNQDDVSAYHLFYADGLASPGSDLTFFEWPLKRERRGTNAIVATALRVSGLDTLRFWERRLDEMRVMHAPIAEVDGRLQLSFEDPEGQRLILVDDGGVGPAHPWVPSPITAAHQIRGLGPITISVPDLASSDAFLTEVMAMRRVRGFEAPDAPGVAVHVYEMGGGGPAAELQVRVDGALPQAVSGAGGVHHVAFRVHDDEYAAWVDRLKRMRIPSSGPVDRFYFRSLYTREPNGILYEIATDGPGFAADEPADRLGESLSLPPFLEHRRAAIEANLRLL